MMQVDADTVYQSPATALDDYDFLRLTYQILLRAQCPNALAIHAAFDALEAAHQRLKVAHLQRLAHLTAEPIH